MGAGAGTTAGAAKDEKTLQDKLALFEKNINEQKAMLTEMAKQMKDLSIDNKEYKDEIKNLKQQIEKLNQDASNEKEANKEKEEKYEKRIKYLASEIERLQKQFKGTNSAGPERAQVAKK